MDGLRGLASFIVFVYHAFGYMPPYTGPILFWFFDGDSAADFFFVLRGFMLARPYVGAGVTRPINYLRLCPLALPIVRDIPITKINGVIWSLIIEMRVSLVFPRFIRRFCWAQSWQPISIP